MFISSAVILDRSDVLVSKRREFGARLEHAGLASTHLSNFLPTDTRSERGTKCHLTQESGHNPGSHLELGSGQKLGPTA